MQTQLNSLMSRNFKMSITKVVHRKREKISGKNCTKNQTMHKFKHLATNLQINKIMLNSERSKITATRYRRNLVGHWWDTYGWTQWKYSISRNGRGNWAYDHRHCRPHYYRSCPCHCHSHCHDLILVEKCQVWDKWHSPA